MLNVEWCSFCTSKPADGHVTVVDSEGMEMILASCEECYKKLL